MPGTVEQREQAARELRLKNQKSIYELPPELQVVGATVKIFNVGPWRHQKSMGSYGQWTIHPCEKGERHSIATEVPYITNDPVHVDMFQMAHRHDSGRKLAADILGIGQFHTPGENLTIWGVFISAGDEPTDAEIGEANKKLLRTFDQLIAEADNYWNQGPSEYKNVTEVHRLAAEKRGQMNKPWARGVVEMMKCPVCATNIDPEAAICGICKVVINQEKVIAHKLPGYEYLWNKPAASGEGDDIPEDMQPRRKK